MDLLVEDVQRDTSVFKLLSLTSPRSLVCRSAAIVRPVLMCERGLQMTPTLPLLKLRFVSITLKDANAKQSRIRLTLFGFTYTFHPDLAWVTDLSEFAKAPPGVGPSPEITFVILLFVRHSSKLFRANEPRFHCPSSMGLS